MAGARASAQVRPDPSTVTMQRLSWAGIRLEHAGVAVFIDATAPNPDAPIKEAPVATKASRSFALVSHHHGDHFDPEALKPVLGAQGYVVAEEGVARQMNPQGVLVLPARMYEPVFLSRGAGEFVAWAVPAVDGLGSPQVSWIVDAGGRRIIHCGDTLWHGGWWSYARAYGPFDVAVLPINGMRQTSGMYRDVTQPMSLTPEQAASASKNLGARLTVPVHYGATGNPAYVEQPQAEARFLKAMAALGQTARVLAQGEILSL
ncbi:MBL fold metallo-hydrolase [Phenylobacterium sp.]|uniref:MBL fold metallo-hydrolase n=1 Tax=Phenylobacterium sp. TaxID=1871053 RepID=UPI002DF16A65|nr:MBL fold metallo-hydrolase [Phenylobacterium sp.]